MLGAACALLVALGRRVCGLGAAILQAPRAAPDTAGLLEKENALQLEIWDIAPKLRDYGVRYGQSTSSIPEAQQMLDLREELLRERKAIDVSEAERDRYAFQQSLEVALRKIASANDPVALRQWVDSEAYGARWALRRLHAEHPTVYAEVLEESLINGEHDKSGKVARLIELIRAEFTNNYLRARSILLLVPEKEPMRYTNSAVEEALLYVVNPSNSLQDKSYNYKSAARALLARDTSRYYPITVENADMVSSSHQKEDFINTLARYAMELPSAEREAFLALIREELRHTGNQMNSLFWLIWSNDLRQLTPELGQLATSAPSETESSDAYRGNTEARLIQGRFHMARQVRALWLEPDLETRAKLDIAFAYQNFRYFHLGRDNRRSEVFASAFQEAVRSLSKAQKKQLVEYSAWCRAQTSDSERDAERLLELHGALVELIGAPI